LVPIESAYASFYYLVYTVTLDVSPTVFEILSIFIRRWHAEVIIQ